MKIPRFSIAVFALLPLTGCFTGIESTPKITASDVRRENALPTTEDGFLAKVTPSPFKEWTAGKRFHVTDDKVSLIFGPTLKPGTKLAGKTITYDSATTSADFTGREVTDLTFVTPDGQRPVYRINRDISTDSASPDVPFTIQKSIIEDARNLLQGKRLYIMTSQWRDSLDRITGGRKFVPVTITDIGYGTANYPIRVTFTDDGSGKEAMLFLSTGDDTKSSRRFAAQFSLDNPRKRYPAITDETWALIIDGKLRQGMTRDECRLSLGAPNDVDRAAGYNAMHEVWSYENGIYLIFEDGLLKTFRH